MAEVREAKEFVFGLYDGALVTLGILSGLSGAGLSLATTTLVGTIHLIAGSFGLGLMTYTSSQSHAAYRKAVYEFERAEIEEHPAREQSRVHDALARKGLRGKALSVAAKEVTEEKDHWARFFVEERFGSAEQHMNAPLSSGFLIALSYASAALLVLLPFFFLPQPYAIIFAVISALGLACYAGISKTRFTHRHPLLSGLESAITTALVAVVSFVGGTVLSVI